MSSILNNTVYISFIHMKSIIFCHYQYNTLNIIYMINISKEISVSNIIIYLYPNSIFFRI